MSLFGWYFLLFAPQLVIGAVIGWWVGQRRADVPGFETFSSAAPPLPPPPPPPDQEEPDQEKTEQTPPIDQSELNQNQQREQELGESLDLLQQLTDSMKDEVREHALKVDVSQKVLIALEAQDGDSDASEVLAALAPIIEANEKLQHKLEETEQKLAEQAEQLEKQTSEARTDPLTGLLNRRGMENELTPLFDQYEQSGQVFCMMILDIDHFKKFNDQYGHDVGDVVLRDVARVVSGAVRTHDIVARFGGEEFIALFPDSELVETKNVAEHVRAAVEGNLIREAQGDLKVTISLGLAQVIAEDAAALLKRADVAMYAAKEAGRNRVYYHDGLHAQPVALEEQSQAADSHAHELAQLPDHRAVAEELKRRILEISRNGEELSLIVLEIDQLADIVIEHGQETAQLVQRGVVRFLTDIKRDMDLLGRADENRLCFMLPNCDLANASRVAERVRSAASQTPFQTQDGKELQLTLSVGIVCALPDDTEESLMERGLNAIECCLESDGNCVFVVQDDADLDNADLDNADLDNADLDNADMAADAEKPSEMDTESATVTGAAL